VVVGAVAATVLGLITFGTPATVAPERLLSPVWPVSKDAAAA